jgi:hypothetical protein
MAANEPFLRRRARRAKLLETDDTARLAGDKSDIRFLVLNRLFGRGYSFFGTQ